ncbi:MAG: Flp family type IVb pilin [Hyphomonas sp.]
MSNNRSLLTRFLSDESGATAIEYGLILGLMVIGIVAALTSVGASTNEAFTAANDGFTN